MVSAAFLDISGVFHEFHKSSGFRGVPGGSMNVPGGFKEIQECFRACEGRYREF